MTIDYKTRGVCSSKIRIELDNDTVRSVEFVGGCRGNAQGVAALCKGMKASEIIARCEGIQCRSGTSCPDQLAQALKGAKQA